MGGVDRFYQRRACYSISRRSGRWWMRIFYFLVDTVLVNSYLLFCSTRNQRTITKLDFSVQLFRALIGTYSSSKRTFTQTFSVKTRPVDQRMAAKISPFWCSRWNSFANVGVHMPQATDDWRQCRACSTKQNYKRSKIICSTCNVHLCVDPCFSKFHTN